MVATKVHSRRKRPLVMAALGALGILLLSVALLLWFRNTEGTILGQAEWPWGSHAYATAPKAPKLLVIRSKNELVQASGLVFDGKGRQGWEEFLTKAFGIENVDFNRRMLVVVVDGIHTTGGYRVEVTNVESDKEHNVLRVYWKLHSPEPGQPVPQPKYPVYPAAVVLLRRFEGEVKLEPLDQPDPKGAEPKVP